MSIKRRQLFVGVLQNDVWTVEKLRAYFNKHASANDEQYIVACEIMSYNDARYEGKMKFMKSWRNFSELLYRKIFCVYYIY